MNNFSAFVQNYKQYVQIRVMKKELNIKEPEDKSPHRRKVKQIKNKFGKKAAWISAVISVLIAYFSFGTREGWYWNIPLVLTLGILYYLIYFKGFGYFAIKSKEVKNERSK